MEDSEIVSLFWERDEKGLNAAAEKFGSYCMKIAQNILGSREDSQECFNDTLLKAWESIPPHRPENPLAFFGKLTRNIAINMHRKNTAAKRGGGEYGLVWEELSECVSDSSEKGGVEERAELADLTGAVNEFLKTLPDTKRKICVLRYSHFEPVADIAVKLGVKESYVLTVISRTRKKLRAFLAEKGFEV
ncbi:MAG: sigma-70 family RNA polymerase sigma factor [Ruminococcaceae bacterium]|nr:sigma-70 family RNA polymerase sigma factor [Oscillospiraceae bacterium]